MHDAPVGKVLQDEVADEHVRNAVLDAREAIAGDDAKLDVPVADVPARPLEHLRRDVDRDDAVEPPREGACHAAGATADLDARAALRIPAEPSEERPELRLAAKRIADVGVGVAGKRVPRRAHVAHGPSIAGEADCPAAGVVRPRVVSSSPSVTKLVELRPRGPYSLALTARFASDATRFYRDGVLTSLLEGDDGLERTRAWQRPDGTVVVEASTPGGIRVTRFVLGIDDDHSEFLRRFSRDPLLGLTLRRVRGLRVLRVPTVAGSLLRALCGQLITSRRARQIERGVLRATSPRVDDLVAPPTAATLGAHSPARLRELGLHARRGATLARVCAQLDLERLRSVPVTNAAARLARERGLGRWSVGVVALQGLGSYRYGLAGDLGLLKLFAAVHGRWPDEGEDETLLAPYDEWQGLASVYLLTGWSLGLIRAARPAAA